MTPSGFTDQDAQLIVDAAQNAPLPNMDAAAIRGGALLRFQAFYKQAVESIKVLADQQVAQKDAESKGIQDKAHADPAA